MEKYYFFVVAFIITITLADCFSDITIGLDEILNKGVKESVYPGVTAIYGDDQEVKYQNNFGRYSYSQNDTPITDNTIFDIASVTKVFATTSAVALLYQEGLLLLDDYVKDIIGDDFSFGGKEDIKIKNCLLHDAGFAPDPDPTYWDVSFNCPNTNDEYPEEDFSCIDKIYKSLMEEKLINNVGDVYLYSDLSFITLQMIVGIVVYKNSLVTENDLKKCIETNKRDKMSTLDPLLIICSYEAYVNKNVFYRKTPNYQDSEEIWLSNTMFRPPVEVWDNCAPTQNDTGNGSYTHKRLQGQVGDGDCYAMGGIAGHAGVFTNIKDIGKFAQYMLQVSRGNDFNTGFLNSTTVKLFTSVYNVSQSSRAFGWTTNNFQVEDFGFDHSCGSMSPQTFMHIGYTGTCICIDPIKNLFSVVLTNRVYNCDGQVCSTGSSDSVKEVYRRFNTAIERINK